MIKQVIFIFFLAYILANMIFKTEDLYVNYKKSSIKNIANKLAAKAMINEFNIEMISNHEISIEGYQSIEEYDENMTKIKANKIIILIYGKDLSIKCMSDDAIVLVGFITSLEFINK